MIIIIIVVIIIIVIIIITIIITKKSISFIKGVFRAWLNIREKAEYI